ncbi:MAG TPA: IPT/TIG domain-containing protein [Thermomicrobiales bacterium]|nr:IPT/TIG domain-containing protein [Thermomicrobiales bacterium]
MTTKQTWVAVIMAALCQLFVACGDHPTPIPTAPSPIPVVAAPVPSPQPAPPAGTPIRPSIAAVQPSVGSTGGGAWGAITGRDFQPGATVLIGGQRAAVAAMQNNTTMLFWTATHDAGSVDITITNPGGLSDTLPGAYTYASPATFDPDAEWIGHAGPDFDTEFHFSIRQGRLVDLTCVSTRLTPAAPTAVENGEFAYRSDTGASLSGRLVSPVNAVGTIGLADCATGAWWAEKGPTQRVAK